MGYLDHFFNLLTYHIGLVSGMCIFVNPKARKKHFGVKTIVCFFVALAAVALCALVVWLFGNGDSLLVSAFIYSLLTLLSPLTIWLMFRQSGMALTNIFFLGMLARQCSSRLAVAINWLIGVDMGSLLSLPVMYACMVAVYVPLFFFSAVKYRNDVDYNPRPAQTVQLGVIISIAFYLQMVESTLAEFAPVMFLALCFGEAAFFGLMLVFQHLLYIGEKRYQHEVIERKLAESKQENQENLRKTMDMVNMKMHDFKHQIAKYADKVDPAVLAELSELADTYRSFITTGYDKLDVILTEKAFRCKIDEIKLKVIADGKPLAFISSPDLVALFGNALDNAIEYLATVPKEDRNLGVYVRQEAGLINIRIENYFAGELTLNERGTPITTKSDKTMHGYGTQSIKYIAAKYHGAAAFAVDGGMFKLTISLPVPKSA